MSGAQTIEHAASLPALTTEATPLTLLERALQQGATVDTLDRIMALYERWQHNEARKAYDAALAEAKAELPVLIKNRKVGFDSKKQGAARTSYMHADLGSIVRVVAPILSKHGLSHRFRTVSNPNEPVAVTCIISHRAGYSEENTLSAGRDDSGNKNAIQAIGSTVTYLSRYTLMAALGLAAAEDDDGQGGDPTPITEAQVQELVAKLDAAGLKQSRFLQRFEIEQLGELPQSELPAALEAIANFVAQKGAKP